eukprot:gene27530-31115_t
MRRQGSIIQFIAPDVMQDIRGIGSFRNHFKDKAHEVYGMDETWVCYQA